ncbi:hypothetical protein AGMMS49940_11010 [Spirochaetia bacterium]|nr:hypothetical protein AGMMS49940_11010 [Spirochaetia bacterium]
MKIPFDIMPFLSYSGCAEEAVNYYISIFPNSKIEEIEYFKERERGEIGKVKTVVFKLMDKFFLAMDMEKNECPVQSWQVSFYFNCIDEKVFDTIFKKLSENGTVLMGPESVFNIRKASWVTDKFGITWQIIWE